jgi:hypothetical protein
MRVIQDSDDEFEGDLEDVTATPQIAPAGQHEAAKDASLPPGTGSTGICNITIVEFDYLQCLSESLKRAFAEAHRNYLQSPPAHCNALALDEPQSSVSLPDHGTKRRKTYAEASPHESPFAVSSMKVPITYGKPSQSGPLGHFMDHVKDETALEATQNCTEFVSDKVWDLPGTLREDYMHHDPNAMFPEPSSTVPNATYTQQRMLENLVAPTLLGINSELDAPQYQPPPEASVPWSDIMKFSPAGTAEQSDPVNPRAEPESEMVPLQQSSEHTKEPLASQHSRCGSSVHLIGSPPRHGVSVDNLNLQELLLPPHAMSQGQNSNLPIIASEGTHDDTFETNKDPSQQKSSRISSLPASQDDVLAADIPLEQYKPRPSRSRSQKVSTEEPVDYSVRPEKAAKMSKRRKTTTAAASTRSTASVDFLSTPQKVRQICDMGFTPTSTGRALDQLNGDVTQTIDWLISNGMGEDELAQPNTPRRRPASKVSETDRTTAAGGYQGVDISNDQEITASKERNLTTETPTKSPNMNTTSTEPNTTIMQPNKDHNKSPKVQVVIHSKSPTSRPAQQVAEPAKTSDKMPKRRKTTSDVPDGEVTFETPLQAEVTTGKKKRGRPKKTKPVALSTETAMNVVQETLQEQDSEARKVLQTIEPNVTNAAIALQSDGHTSKDIQTQAHVSSIQPSNSPPPGPSRTPEESSKPSPKPSSHTSAVKGKTPYRVGLSKRARIAPLLRVVKK